MASRIWENVNVPASELSIFVSFKSTLAIDAGARIFDHIAYFNIVNKGNTQISTTYGDVTLDADYCDNQWHSLLLEVKSNGDVWVFIDALTIPFIISNGVSLVGGISDLQVGGDGISYFGLRIIKGSLGMSEAYENFIHKDIVENNGNVFFEVV